MKPLMLVLLAALISGCSGTVATLSEGPEPGGSAILIGCRIILPTGETQSGELALNLEEEGAHAEIYRIPLTPKNPLLYQVSPGKYKITPTRGTFGAHQINLTVLIEGREYQVPFPREILRKETIVVKPSKIFAIGIVEVTLSGRTPGREPTLRVVLDDGVEARRSIIQQIIRNQMDPSAPSKSRTIAIGWTRALERSLTELVTETERNPNFRPVP